MIEGLIRVINRLPTSYHADFCFLTHTGRSAFDWAKGKGRPQAATWGAFPPLDHEPEARRESSPRRLTSNGQNLAFM